jgi:hypothetical protein
VVAVLLVVVIARLGFLDMTALTTFTDRWAGVSFPMIPPPEMPWLQQLWLVLLMRVSPTRSRSWGSTLS